MVRIVTIRYSNNSKNGSNNSNNDSKIRIAILANPQECSGMLTSLAETRKRFLHSLLGIGLDLSSSQKQKFQTWLRF